MTSPLRAQPAAADERRPGFDARWLRASAPTSTACGALDWWRSKTGPKPMPAAPDRDAMFKGHFANMKRLADDGKLALAGPCDGLDGRRGLFILAVPDIDAARRITAIDPVISSGEMLAEYHRYYGSAALMLVNDGHGRVAREAF